MSSEEITSRVDDIVFGLWGGVKFESDRFEQEHRELTKPEPLDPHEQKAMIILLLNDLGIKI